MHHDFMQILLPSSLNTPGRNQQKRPKHSKGLLTLTHPCVPAIEFKEAKDIIHLTIKSSCPLAIPPVHSRTYVWSLQEKSSFAPVLVRRSLECFEGLHMPADKEQVLIK